MLAGQWVAVTLVFGVSQATKVNEEVTPIAKVLDMLQGMLHKGEVFKQQEKEEFAKFHVYCDKTREQTKKAIKTGAENILQLTADVGKNLADAEELAEDIKEEEADVAKMEAELEKATEVRKKERSDYEAMHKDFTESIDALGRATKVVKSRSKDVPQSLLQLQSSTLIPARAKAAIQSFIALGDSIEVEGPPEAHAYEFQSGGILAILEKLRIKFEDQRTTLEKEEVSTKGAFELLSQKLTDSIKDGKTTISDKTAVKAKKLEAAADGKGDLEIAKKGKTEDEKDLDSLNTECDLKSEEYEKNQATRADELKAMKTAVEILGSEVVSGTAEKHKMTLIQDGGVSFASLRHSSSDDKDRRKRVVSYLQRRATALGSKYLSLVAVRALTDPFGKVKKMIKDLIVKLMEEANSEADQKGYCDAELATNKITRDDKSADVEELTAEVEKLTSDLAKIAEDLKDLTEEVTDLRTSQKKATELRQKEKALNTETITEAKAAQVAVEKATQVLKSFYSKAADVSLLQDSDSESVGEEMAEATNVPYQGMQGQKGGVVGMLEVILSDFARLESTTSSAEDESAATYDKFMNESNQDIAVKLVEVDHLEKKSQTTAETIRNSKKELKATQEELSAALEYYEKLKPDCVDAGLSYEDRVEMRQAEIQSLQEALKTLSSEAL